MAGIVVADTLQADSTSTLIIKNGVANTPPTIQDSAGTQIGTFCRAWVNFNGTLVTNPASMTGVRASFNVSSVLDNGVGDYTINFTTAMPDINFDVNGTCSSVTGANAPVVYDNSPTRARTTSTVSVRTIDATNFGDPVWVNVSVFR